MQWSHSRVETFKNCPYKFSLHYLYDIKTLPNTEATNALYLGTAIHSGVEKGIEAAIKEYFDSYNVIDDLHINEEIKIRALVPKLKAAIPEGQFEVPILTNDFKGFIDLLVPVEGQRNLFDIYDFKYSNNSDRYLESGQLHEYKYFYEQQNPNHTIRNLYFVFVSKIQIRQKKTEDLYQFRQRLLEELEKAEIRIEPVKYQPEKVIEFLLNAKQATETKQFEKVETFCKWCDYEPFCKRGETYCLERMEEMKMLPKNERVNPNAVSYMKGWIYGAPFSGKTTFLDSAPDPLNLNTDGNVKYVTMQRLRIRDEITVEGRITKKKFAWEVFKDSIAELEKGSDFKTIIVDLVEDTREMCRLYMYDKLNIQHESDSGYGKGWDIIKTEYLSTMRRLLNLDYHVFLVSHEDISKDITKRGGDKVTRIAPNIQEAIANKLAGMVDFVARVVVNDDDSRILSFKANEVTFGGGRLTALNGKTIPLNWEALMNAYDEAKKGVRSAVKVEEKQEEPVKQEETKLAEDVKQVEIEEKEMNEAVASQIEPNSGEAMTPPVEEKPRRTRKKRGE